MKNLFLLLALLIMAFSNAKAAGKKDNLTEADLAELESLVATKKTTTKKSKKRQKIHSGDQDLSIAVTDEELGISLGNYNTSFDKNRYSLLVHASPNFMEISDFIGFEFIYGRKMDFAWWEISATRSQASFDEITDIDTTVINASKTDLEESTSTLLTVGTGLSYRSNLIQNLISWHDLYETTSAHIQYVSMTEEVTSESLSGLGFKADFGIHKRSSKSFHYGLKMSYNIANVKRAALTDTETSSARSLTLNWISLALDLTYYF